MAQTTLLIDGIHISRDVCCERMADAFQEGYDGRGIATTFDNLVFIGDELPAIRYCPWCGRLIDWKWLDVG